MYQHYMQDDKWDCRTKETVKKNMVYILLNWALANYLVFKDFLKRNWIVNTFLFSFLEAIHCSWCKQTKHIYIQECFVPYKAKSSSVGFEKICRMCKCNLTILLISSIWMNEWQLFNKRKLRSPNGVLYNVWLKLREVNDVKSLQTDRQVSKMDVGTLDDQNFRHIPKAPCI